MANESEEGHSAEALQGSMRRFVEYGGIPLDVIQELFARMKLPEKLQAAFWQEVRKKDFFKLKDAKVDQVDTDAKGKTSITCTGKDGSLQTSVSFDQTRQPTPDEIGDAQIGEFKRAQNFGLCVDVTYQNEEGHRVVNKVSVHKCPPPPVV